MTEREQQPNPPAPDEDNRERIEHPPGSQRSPRGNPDTDREETQRGEDRLDRTIGK